MIQNDLHLSQCTLFSLNPLTLEENMHTGRPVSWLTVRREASFPTPNVGVSLGFSVLCGEHGRALQSYPPCSNTTELI